MSAPTSDYPVVAPKKLIEVALPLDAINKACAREKALRHGHPSTLHLWWGDLYPEVEVTKALTKTRPDLKPLVGQRLTVIAWLWARTVASPNPALPGTHVPLVTSWVLSKKPGAEAWIEPLVTKAGYSFRVATTAGGQRMPEGVPDGTKEGRGANFRCLVTGSPIAPEYIRNESAAGRLGQRLLAVVCAGTRERLYFSPQESDEVVAMRAKASWRPDIAFARNSRHMTPHAYGLTTFATLHTERQLAALSTLADLAREVEARVEADAIAGGRSRESAASYARAVACYLALAVGKLADIASTLCTWHSGASHLKIRNTFGRQALSMTWDFAEGNPFSESSGNFLRQVDLIAEVVQASVVGPQGRAYQASAVNVPLQARVVSTDPPYYDNVPYADLSDFFYVWLRRALRRAFPEVFETLLVPKAEELVADAFRHGSRDQAERFFLDGMKSAVQNIAIGAHPAFPVTVYYAFKQSDTAPDGGTSSAGWETFLRAVTQSGLVVTGTWPMSTELGNRMRSNDSNALASSVVLVCRRRGEDAATATRKEFVRQLERAVPAALTEMTADPVASVAPVDLAQAAIGPGMAIFSQYASVLEADGSPMSVHDALIHINKAIDNFFAQAEGDLDADTRFCIDWFQQRGFEPGPFGEADVLARAKGTAVDGVVETGVLSATKGKVRLHRVKDYPKKWDPREDARVPIWEACHQMCRALGESEHEAGALLARMPEKQDAIRQLAYRLYTICERQKWAEEARSYNELVTSWPAIVEGSHSVGHKGKQLELGGGE